MSVFRNRARYDLTVYKGESYQKDAWFKMDGSYMDLTGYTVTAQARPSSNSDVLICDIDIDLDPLNGHIVMSINDIVTETLNPGIYAWDLKMIDPDGGVYYRIYGKFIVEGRVTV